jgi:uncharacterized protein
MDVLITDTEARVLGCLIEKEFSTPEYYPMSLNALVNACNQKSNRDPVVSYDEETVLRAIDGLKGKQLVFQSHGERVSKYEETFLGSHNFIGSEGSVLCELLVRGPQTPGELRTRTERMHDFKGPDEFSEAISKLESYGYVVRLERQPGRKESRYAHMLSGRPGDHESAAPAFPGHAATASAGDAEKITALEEKLDALQHGLQELKQAFLDFKQQFE